jgi:predicted alpha/beta hydrolase family esterase
MVVVSQQVVLLVAHRLADMLAAHMVAEQQAAQPQAAQPQEVLEAVLVAVPD